MPRTTDTLAIFAARGPLTTAEWYQLIEARKGLIGPYLDRFTLKELRAVECLYRETRFTGTLGGLVCSSGGFSLETQGIFGHSFKSRKKMSQGVEMHAWHGDLSIPADGRLSIWGLTRQKTWIVAIVSYKGSAGYKDRGREDATHVRIEEVKLPAMVKLSCCTPQEIWLALGKQLREFVEIRRNQYEGMREITELMAWEDRLAQIIR